MPKHKEDIHEYSKRIRLEQKENQKLVNRINALTESDMKTVLFYFGSYHSDELREALSWLARDSRID